MERDRGYVQIVHTWIPEGNDPFVCWPLWVCVEELRTYWYMRIFWCSASMLSLFLFPIQSNICLYHHFQPFPCKKDSPYKIPHQKLKKIHPLFRGGIARLVAKLLWLEPGHPDLDSEIQGEKLCEQKRGGYVDNLDDHPPLFFGWYPYEYTPWNKLASLRLNICFFAPKKGNDCLPIIHF